MENSVRPCRRVVYNFYGNINHFYQAPVCYNAPVTNAVADGRPTVHYDDRQIARAIEAINGEGKALDTKQKWAGVYWLLRWQCNFPVRGSEFCERINRLPFEHELEIKCDYNNIRSLNTLSFMKEDPRQLDRIRYSKSDEKVFFQLKQVVTALENELQKTSYSGKSY